MKYKLINKIFNKTIFLIKKVIKIKKRILNIAKNRVNHNKKNK